MTDETLAGLDRRARRLFRHRFDREPKFVVAAPGRVNVIGEHTDYNDGFVLPMAIDRHVVIAADESTSETVQFYSALSDEDAIFRLGVREQELPSWVGYVRGVLELGLESGLSTPGIEAVIESNVPSGAGLSSSAALEVATATLAEAMSHAPLPPLDKARLCQRAEQEYAGVPCGIMDQAISVMGRRDHLLLLDCRSLNVRFVPFDDPAVGILVSNTKVRHDLGDGEYARRRADCDAAAKALGVEALRDTTIERLSDLNDLGMEETMRRARHVVSENARTLEAAAAMACGDYERTGLLMNASHVSLRDDFEVSCAELDLLVEIAQGIGPKGGVFGCRMTGAGFGGCTVSLIRMEYSNEIMETLRYRYREETGIEPDQFVTRPVDGARVLDNFGT